MAFVGSGEGRLMMVSRSRHGCRTLVVVVHGKKSSSSHDTLLHLLFEYVSCLFSVSMTMLSRIQSLSTALVLR
ncbi:hypothetical protein HBI56_141670 [Parastagonospora nodorum]|uniref:Uncharacterized protein n=1 Tax=Phaeosphaeria nodorum (strain SN15 / ATCC MYA-4574 / FGSC 10173) TaxID=321614 RepID=A0A7U2FBT9_PHANO|nr:hypothetical protein HBH56_035400 [Parastagonospora nodorum]QRD00100.1 hypothetical protein JI435_414560 [Parastagonospora nodorum SN15]KAH3933915.1 hypothetical protein HBH54_064060 [Parastagonospora nodorum]KAH3952762.1 hypothetical protein HBH53_046040 [Parastagonospora nodorum]KAH3979775.1 hypothetical protein HBH51_057060 [Parastagonospora nodorum]